MLLGLVRVLALVLVCSAVVSPVPSLAGETSFDRGVHAYDRGDYDEALELFVTIEEAGAGTPALFYNLGNTYLRLNRLGLAIYNYEKAALAAPGDDDIAFNLAYARSLAIDRQEHGRSALGKALFFLHGQLAPLAIELLFLVLAGAGWLCLGLAPKRPSLKQAAWTLFFLSLLIAPSALYQQYQAHIVEEGIILSDALDVRAGLSDEATTLFTLHAGSRVSIEDKRQGWLRIRFGEDKMGWVLEDAIGRL